MSKSFYQRLYAALTAPLRGKKRLIKAFSFVEKAFVYLLIATYAFIVFYALLRPERSWPNALATLGLPAACLVVVSVLRKLIARPRPYEREGAGIVPLLSKDSTGNSLPSRHAACAFVIATTAFSVHPILGGGALALATAICAFRFVFGLHYPEDLLCGALLGAAFGIPVPFL